MIKFNFIKEICEILNENNISYLILRNYDFLIEEREPEGQSEQGLDMVVKNSDFKRFKRVLIEEGFIISKPSFSRKHVHFVAIKDLEIISFDVQVGGIHWNDICYLKDSVIFSYCQKKSFFYTLSDNDMYVMLIAHSILGKRRFKDGYQDIISCLNNIVDEKYVFLRLQEIFTNDQVKFILNEIKNLNFSKILKKKNSLIFYFIFKSIKNFFIFTLLFFRWLKWKKLFVAYPLISVVGPDGSGKSSLTKNIISFLKKHGYSATLVYNGRGRDHILPMTKLGFAYKIREKKKDFENKQKIKKKFNLKKNLIYTMASPIFTIDLLLRYMVRIFPKRHKRKYVVTDRYCSDIMLMKHVPFWIKKLFLSLFPKPTISIYLYNDAKILHQRRPEESIEELERQMNIFKCFKYTYSIKTDDEKEDTERVLSFILCDLFKKGF